MPSGCRPLDPLLRGPRVLNPLGRLTLITTPDPCDRRNSLTSGAARSIRMVVKHLYEAIQDRVCAWRKERNRFTEYPVISEILDYARLPESEALRFLRRPQLRALDTCSYLRLIEGTPKILDRYSRHIMEPTDSLAPVGVPLTYERVGDIHLSESGFEELPPPGFTR